MEKSFPVILSELRKERGLSQKDAASSLGISQALLSHYEKGIRECGHSFLIKVADFYGVTCDYLLGRSADRTGSSRLSLLMEKRVDDEKAGSGTMLKAALMLRDHLSGGTRDYGFDFDRLVILEAYRIILLEAEAGRLPKNWAGRAYSDGELYCNPLFLELISQTLDECIKPTKAKRPAEETPPPKPLETLVKAAEQLIFKHMAEYTPPIPYEYVK